MTQMVTCRWTCWTVLLLMPLAGILAGAQTSSTQSEADPYRGLVGVWAGTILVIHEHLPKDVSLTITEFPGEKESLWDYTFGHRGQKGFQHTSKIVTFLPAESKMLFRYVGVPEQTLETHGLNEFASKGIGTFTACASLGERNFWGRKTDASSCVTYRVEPSKFTYVWKTTRNGITSIWSQFEFTRVGDPSARIPATVNKK